MRTHLNRVRGAKRHPEIGIDDVDEAAFERALEMTLHTLRAMARGGMHDHLGGGFHRDSTDVSWHVPHVEKMLYDQAQLAISYSDGYQITKEPFFAEIARDILEYVLRDMRGPEGGFYSAENADSLIEEGKPELAEGRLLRLDGRSDSRRPGR